MAHLNLKQILEATATLVEKNPGGIRFGEIQEWFRTNHPETPSGTVTAQISSVPKSYPDRVTKVGRGLYAPVATKQGRAVVVPPVIPTAVREEEFYASFAEYLQDDLDEVVRAVPLGGAAMRAKWGTPDVVGVYRPTTKDLIKFNQEIVSAEVKVDPREPVTAFGQAVSYRLFSTKCYVVMPSGMSEADKSRLEALSMLFGIGLVLFEPNPKAPNYSIRVRAQRFIPDMFYVNEFADRMREIDSDAFERLFG
ncbi:MAG: hypothetical protein ACOYN0_02450 [Phycisphaerales bacterium]